MKRKWMLLAVVALPLLSARADDPSRAVIGLSWEGGLPFLTFDLTSGTGYWIEERTNLLAGTWDPAGSGYAQYGAETHPLTAGESGSRFYRLSYEEDVVAAEEGEEWDTFDFAVLSNRVDELQMAHCNQGYGNLLIITNHAAGLYLSETDEATIPDEVVTTTRQTYEGTNAVYQHMTLDTVMDFYHAPVSMPAGPQPLSNGGGTPGGVGLTCTGGHAFSEGSRSRVTISVRGNVVTAGSFTYDFSQPPLGWGQPSIGERILELWRQGPRPFDPYPPCCGDAIAICNARMFSVLEQRTAVYSWGMRTETYQFLFDYCYEYTCPDGPLRKILVVLFKYSYVVRDKSGNVTYRNAQNAYFAGDEPP